VRNYNEIIEFSNINIAVCDIVKKKKGVYQPFFDNFYPFVKESFNNNYSKFIEFAEKKFNDTEVQNKVFKTGFYNMNIIIDYESILHKLNETKETSQILSP
jgi:hypothetical protein